LRRKVPSGPIAQAPRIKHGGVSTALFEHTSGVPLK